MAPKMSKESGYPDADEEPVSSEVGEETNSSESTDTDAEASPHSRDGDPKSDDHDKQDPDASGSAGANVASAGEEIPASNLICIIEDFNDEELANFLGEIEKATPRYIKRTATAPDMRCIYPPPKNV